MKSTIYYLHKGDHIPFYVGETLNPHLRIYDHKDTYGDNTQLERLKETKNWRRWEKHYIKKYKKLGYKLTNKNAGGGGVAKGTPKPEGFSETQKIARKNITWRPSKQQIINASKAKMKTTYQYDLDGNLIAEYESSKAAAIAVGIHEVNMRLHLGGKYKTCKGFKFKYGKQ